MINFGTITMLGIHFQSDFVFSGSGGKGGNGGDGDDGGDCTVGGCGGVAGSGGNDSDASVTVFNRGTMHLAGGWIYMQGPI